MQAQVPYLVTEEIMQKKWIEPKTVQTGPDSVYCKCNHFKPQRVWPWKSYSILIV